MENAVDAMEMAFAMFVFVLALTITFMAFGKIKSTADSVLWINDDSRYLEYLGDEYVDENGITQVTGQENLNAEGFIELDDGREVRVIRRVVGINDIIPTLYSYSTELYKVTIKFDENDENTWFDFYNENEVFAYQYQRKFYIDNFVSGAEPRHDVSVIVNADGHEEEVEVGYGWSNIIKHKLITSERKSDSLNYFNLGNISMTDVNNGIIDDITILENLVDAEDTRYVTVVKDFQTYNLMEYKDFNTWYFIEEYIDENDIASWSGEDYPELESGHEQTVGYTHITYTLKKW